MQPDRHNGRFVHPPLKSAELEKRTDGAVPQEAHLPGVRGRILVVDDEPAIRVIMKRMLGPEHEVVAAASGRAARVILAKDPSFDLIFCDLMMPEMTGMELHTWLAKKSPALAAQMVFITGGAFTPGASAYLASAGNLTIAKPFNAAIVKWLAAELMLTARTKPGRRATSGCEDGREQ
jgi:CheY-like chemotaxis protein